MTDAAVVYFLIISCRIASSCRRGCVMAPRGLDNRTIQRHWCLLEDSWGSNEVGAAERETRGDRSSGESIRTRPRWMLDRSGARSAAAAGPPRVMRPIFVVDEHDNGNENDENVLLSFCRRVTETKTRIETGHENEIKSSAVYFGPDEII